MYFWMTRLRFRPFVSIQSLSTLYYFTCYFGVIYATYWFHKEAFVLLLIMMHETYLFIIGDQGGSPIYHYLLLEHVTFIYVADVSILLMT